MGEYLVGLRVEYLLNSKYKTVRHIGSGNIESEVTISCEPFEHIDIMKVSYDSFGILSVFFSTNLGKNVVSIS